MKVAASSLDTMVYPLIHLHAEDSWLRIESKSKRKRQRDEPHSSEQSNGLEESGTIRAYLAYRLQKRDGDLGVLRRSRSLFLQWLVDSAVRIIDQNLAFARKHQTVLQVCRYDALVNYVHEIAERKGKRPGRIYVMPSNEQRSERQLFVDYNDAVRISLEFGPPSLFITFTCNPMWAEVRRELEDMGMSESDYVYQPDIVNRVFLAKKHIFMSDVINKCVLGRTQAYVSVDEFQKTGLSHTHLALILDPVDRPSEPIEVDRILTAEIPSPEEDAELHNLVMTFMIHRPCDGSCSTRRQTGCRLGSPDVCKHGFPKNFLEHTFMAKYGPELRRRRGPKYWHRGYRCFVDNRWVIPYNPRLLRRYRCHLNVLVCATGLPFKYIYGYMDKMKTGDTAHVTRAQYVERQMGETVIWDEISHFEAMRYIGPSEAVYRIYGQPFGKRSHPVECLPVHLENEQSIYYREGEGGEPPMPQNKSKMLAWFDLNRVNPHDERIRTMLYQDVVKRFR